GDCALGDTHMVPRRVFHYAVSLPALTGEALRQNDTDGCDVRAGAPPLLVTNVAPAPLFRCIEEFRPTLLLDEADTWLRENEELRGILNGGHSRKTACVIRCVGDEHDVRAFSTFCPKA